MMEILRPWPAARRTVPKAAVVLPLPSPVKICTRPLAFLFVNGAPLKSRKNPDALSFFQGPWSGAEKGGNPDQRRQRNTVDDKERRYFKEQINKGQGDKEESHGWRDIAF